MSKWSPQNDEPALTLAAIRWYALSLEKLATDLYVTDRNMYPEVQAVLSKAFIELGKLRGYCIPSGNAQAAGGKGDKARPPRFPAGRWADKLQAEKLGAAESYGAAGATGATPRSAEFAAQSEDGCSPGYVYCNGVCLPECDNIAEY